MTYCPVTASTARPPGRLGLWTTTHHSLLTLFFWSTHSPALLPSCPCVPLARNIGHLPRRRRETLNTHLYSHILPLDVCDNLLGSNFDYQLCSSERERPHVTLNYIYKQTIDNHQNCPVSCCHNNYNFIVTSFYNKSVPAISSPRMSFQKNQGSELNQEVTSTVIVYEIYGVTTTVMLSTVNTVPRDKMLNIISPGFLIILAGAPTSSNQQDF